MGFKQRAIGNTLEKQIGNLVGTHWELEGNMLEQRKNYKKPSPHTSTQNFLHEISISKTVHHHFWPRLTGRGRILGT
jgi:hypothetical protein